MVCMSSGELLRPGNRFLLSCITFLELNHDLLESYSEADTSKDVVRVQNEFLESKE